MDCFFSYVQNERMTLAGNSCAQQILKLWIVFFENLRGVFHYRLLTLNMLYDAMFRYVFTYVRYVFTKHAMF